MRRSVGRLPTMTRHVLDDALRAPCAEAAGGLIELRTDARRGSAGRGRRRPRGGPAGAPPALQRDRHRLERAQAAPAPPRARAVGATRERRLGPPRPHARDAGAPTTRRAAGMSTPPRRQRDGENGGGGRARAPPARPPAAYAAERDVVDEQMPPHRRGARASRCSAGASPPRRARRDAAVYYDLTAQRPASAVPRARTQCARGACERCARETATRALHSDDGRVACPAEDARPRCRSRRSRRCCRPRRTRPLGTGRPSTASPAAKRAARRDTIALHRQLPYHHALALAPPPPPANVGGRPSACDMCAPCAARWLEIQARDGAIYTRCPTPGCKTPLPREALELLLEPEALQRRTSRVRARDPRKAAAGPAGADGGGFK